MPPELSTPPHVSVAMKHRIGTLDISVAFRVRAPWTILFGPSGSGKSTVLRSIAGLLRPDEACIEVLGQIVDDQTAGTWVPPHRRRTRWAGQRSALFPKRSVRSNLAIALQAQTPAGAKGDLQQALDTFGLNSLAEKYPAELSGGERQCVSLVRAAIGARGRVLLLDEPFSGLDAHIRDALIAGLKTWLGDTPILSVTHDVGEVFLLKAEVIRLDQGRIVAQGTAAEVLDEERARWKDVLG